MKIRRFEPMENRKIINVAVMRIGTLILGMCISNLSAETDNPDNPTLAEIDGISMTPTMLGQPRQQKQDVSQRHPEILTRIKAIMENPTTIPRMIPEKT